MIRRILLIESEPVLRHFSAAVLAAAGHQVDIAGLDSPVDVAHAWTPVDLVITDALKPGHVGFDTLMRFRRQQPFVPLLALFGGTPADVALGERVARIVGATSVLQKPFTAEELQRAVARIGASRAPFPSVNRPATSSGAPPPAH